MAPKANEYLEQFKKSLEGWTDERFVSRAELQNLAMFSMYIVNLAEEDGWGYAGHSWKESEHLGCLVVKADRDGIPQVVFTSARTYTEGIRVFLKKMDAGFLEWRDDKYRS